MTTREIRIGQQTLSLETGKLAKQAGGSVMVRFGDSVVLVTACRAANAREGIDFLPLTVDYREYTYASGRIPGGFFKREGKPAEKEVLTSRCIDRPITAAVSGRMAVRDADHRARPVGRSGERHRRPRDHRRVRGARAVGDSVREDDRRRPHRSRRRPYVVNPTFQQRKESKLDLIVAGSNDGLVMVEAGAKEVTEEQVVQALETAHAAIKEIVAAIDDLAREAGKKKMVVARKEIGHEFYREVEEKIFVPLTEAMRIRGKLENYDRVDEALKDLVASIPEGEVVRKVEAKADLQGAEGEGPA